MIDPRKQFTPSENEQNISNWEQTLQELREKRKHQVEPNTQQNPAPQTTKSAAPIIRPKPQGRENLETNKEVLEQYLEQWQVAHNISTDENKAQNPYGDADNDTNVVLVEEWIEAQHSLQGEVSLDGVQKVIYGDFNCFKNVLESLKDGPEIVKEVYYCNENPIKTWAYLPKEVQHFRWHKERKDPILSFEDVCKLKEIQDNYSELNNNLVSVDNKRKRLKI